MWIYNVDAASEHGDGAAIQGTGVSGGIDTPRHAGDNDISGLREVTGKGGGKCAAVCGGVARADDGECGLAQQRHIADRRDKGRGIIGLGQQVRE